MILENVGVENKLQIGENMNDEWKTLDLRMSVLLFYFQIV